MVDPNLNVPIVASSKQLSPRTETEPGMSIDRSELFAKHDASILISVGSGSKFIESIAILEKVDAGRIRITLGIRIDGSEGHSAKHKISNSGKIDEFCTNGNGSSNVNVSIFEFRNNDRRSVPNDPGIERSFTEASAKTRSSTCFNRMPYSNVSFSIFVLRKHELPRISTERGTQIDCKQLPKKHLDPILVKCEFDSNNTMLRIICDNHISFSIVTERGIRIDGRGRQSVKHDLSIVGNLICVALSSGTSNLNVVIAEPRNHDRTTFRIEKGRQSNFSDD
jgi:hypothetical protein